MPSNRPRIILAAAALAAAALAVPPAVAEPIPACTTTVEGPTFQVNPSPPGTPGITPQGRVYVAVHCPMLSQEIDSGEL